MCGIFGVVNDQSVHAAEIVLEGLKKLEYRGYDSWGIALVSNSKSSLALEKHVGKIGQAITSLPNGNTALGHTRWATHGGVTDSNAHPHLDCTGTIAVIHNGIVENYQELKEELILNGHKFVSETDTEVIAHLVEEGCKRSDIREATLAVFERLIGSNAIGVLDLKTQSIVACRNGSPLVVGIGKKTSYIASDVTAFLQFTKSVHFLADGEAVEITKDGIRLYDLGTKSEKKFTVETINWEIEDAEKGGYPHFLLKEIMEQKITIPKTAKINSSIISEVAQKINKGNKLVFVGCGTAAYCGLAASYFFARHEIPSKSYGAYEYLPYASFADSETVVVAISQSGETADTIIAVKAAKKRGAQIVALVNARGSTLERMADYVIPVGAGPEIAVVSTKAFTSQLATLYLLAYAVRGKYAEGKKNIINLEKKLADWLSGDQINKIIELAKILTVQEHAYLIGKYSNYPAALEFGLKLKESAYLHAEAFASGELKHGVIALIQKRTPCFVLSSNDEIKGEVLSSATELKARGGYIIGVAPYEATEFDYHVRTPEMGDLTIFGNIIAGQLLGYHLGIGRCADPDKPRNLAKSVTVK